MTTLLQHIQKMMDARQRQQYANLDEQQQPGRSKPSVTAEAVNIETGAKLAKLLFGPGGEANATPAMSRLLDSWVELGYPTEGKLHRAQCNQFLENMHACMPDVDQPSRTP